MRQRDSIATKPAIRDLLARIRIAESKLNNVRAQLQDFDGQTSRILSPEGQQIGEVKFQDGRFVVVSGQGDTAQTVDIELASAKLTNVLTLGVLRKMRLLPEADGSEESEKLAVIKALGRLTHQFLAHAMEKTERKEVRVSEQNHPEVIPVSTAGKSVQKTGSRTRTAVLAATLGLASAIGLVVDAKSSGPNVIETLHHTMDRPTLDEKKTTQITQEMNRQLEAGARDYKNLLASYNNSYEAEVALIQALGQNQRVITPELFGSFRHDESQKEALTNPLREGSILDLHAPLKDYYESALTYAVRSTLDDFYKALLAKPACPAHLLEEFLAERGSETTAEEITMYIQQASVITRGTLHHLKQDELLVLALEKTDTEFQIVGLPPRHNLLLNVGKIYRHDDEPHIKAKPDTLLYQALFRYLAKIDFYNWENLVATLTPDEQIKIVWACREIHPRHYRVYGTLPLAAQIDFVEHMRPDGWKDSGIAQALHRTSNEHLRQKIEAKVKENGGTFSSAH